MTAFATDLELAPPTPGEVLDIDQQLREAGLFPGAGGEIHYIHGSVEVPGAKKPIRYTTAVPENVTIDTHAMIVPGFGAFKWTSRHWRDEMAQLGIPTTSYDPARLQVHPLDLEQLVDPQRLHAETIGRILSSHALTELGGLPKTLIPHSMGGLAVARYITEHPDEIDAAIFVSAVGVEGPLGLRLIPRTGSEFVHDIIPAILSNKFGYSPVIAKRGLEYFVRNPFRSIAEAISCMTADIRPSMQFAVSCDVQLGAICLGNDRFFHPEDNSMAAAQIINPRHIKTLDGLEHAGPQTHPVPVARAVGQLLSSFNLGN